MGNESHIGRAKTVLVSGEGPAVITVIIAKTIEERNSQNLIFSGNVHFDESVKEHIHETILPHVDELSHLLNITPSSYELTAVNIGAVSSSDIELLINGYSADVSIFIAMLSASMKLHLEQDIVYTGHIASKEGDISQVQNLEAKSKAAIIDGGVSTFVYPSLDSDSSLKILKPKEYDNSKAAMRSCRGKIKLLDVYNTNELIKKSISDEAIVLSSLNSNFFGIKIDVLHNSSFELISKYFLDENNERFWRSLEYNLLNKDVKKSHLLLNTFIDYHLRKNKYPKKFGEELNKLIMSLPFSVKKTSGLFPLIKKDKYIRLIENATENAHNDISILHNVLYGKIEGKHKFFDTRMEEKVNGIDASDRLEYILEQINPDYIDLNITKPIDEARASYVIDGIQADSYDDLIDTITSFYIHIFRYTNNLQVVFDKEKFSIEALELFKNTFPQKSEFNEAISIALTGNKGGLRFIFDMITEYMKKETRDNYVSAIINDAINPLDYQLRKRLIGKIIKRETGRLELDSKMLRPEQYVENYIEIIKEYARSKQSLNRIFKIY
jgi:hypothetical protein